MEVKMSEHEVSTVPNELIIVVPCLNEREHISNIIDHFCTEARELGARIIIVDGGSTDGTAEIAKNRALTDPVIEFIANDRVIQSAAVNKAVAAFGGSAKFLVRVDAHSAYPENFCRRLIEAQQATDADSVVVAMDAEGASCFQKAAAVAQNSKLGNGGAAHRSKAGGRFVDHGHHALMRIESFRRVGGYDEAFTHNEDAELDVRLIAAGYRIYMTNEANITYFPRAGAVALFRQYFNFGRGRARNAFKHRTRLRLRQALPIAVAPAVALALLSPLIPVLAVPAALWLLICICYGLLLGFTQRSLCGCLAGVAAIIMHFAFSAGFLRFGSSMMFGRRA